MTSAIDVLRPVVKVAGAELNRDTLGALHQLRVDRELCNTGEAVLHFGDFGYKLADSDTFAVGKEIVITARVAKKSVMKTLFNGIITGLAVEQRNDRSMVFRNDGIPELVVTAHDRSALLGLGNTIKTYNAATDSAVISEMLRPYRLTANVAATSVTHDYLLQNGSDRALLDTLTARNGQVWWVDGDALHTASPATTTPGPTLTLGDNLLDFSVRGTALRPTGLSVTGWDSKQAVEVKGTPTAGTPGATSSFAARFGSDQRSSVVTQGKRVDASLAPENEADAGVIASALMTEWNASAVNARGRCYVQADIDLLSKVEVAGTGPARGHYVVTRVEHSFHRATGFWTVFTAGSLRPAGRVDAPGPSSSGPLTLTGLYAATVSDNNDADGLGRVKVRYVAVAGGQVESNWARVVTVGGGAGRGVAFHPEVGDEVLIGFERGDSRHPVVVGGLHSGKTAFPIAKGTLVKSDKTNVRSITSREGHVIEMCDDTSPTQSGITLKHKDGHSLRLGGDKTEISVAKAKPITITNGKASIEIDESGAITIKGMRLTVKTQAGVQVDAQTAVNITAGATMKLEGKQTTVKGTFETQVDGGAMATIKGGMVKIN